MFLVRLGDLTIKACLVSFSLGQGFDPNQRWNVQVVQNAIKIIIFQIC